jgi:hypothetical protein
MGTRSSSLPQPFLPDNATRAASVDRAIDTRNQIRLATLVLPWSLAGVGVVLLTLSGLLLRRSTRRSEDGLQDDDGRTLAARAGPVRRCGAADSMTTCSVITAGPHWRPTACHSQTCTAFQHVEQATCRNDLSHRHQADVGTDTPSKSACGSPSRFAEPLGVDSR